MRQIVLKAFQELGPCGVRTVVKAIDEEHAEVKTLAYRLATQGYLFLQSNTQFRITDKGVELLKELENQPAQVPTSFSEDPEPAPERKPDPQPQKSQLDKINTAFKSAQAGLAKMGTARLVPAQQPEKQKPAPKPQKQSLTSMSTDELIQLAYDTNDFLLAIRKEVRDRVAGIVGLDEGVE